MSAIGVWRGMISRCYNPNAGNYKNYGGRGITVCDRWRFGGDGKSGRELFLELLLRPNGLVLLRR
jgi:hypothetical protein